MELGVFFVFLGGFVLCAVLVFLVSFFGVSILFFYSSLISCNPDPLCILLYESGSNADPYPQLNVFEGKFVSKF
jgi:hypothetical protein